MSSEYKRGDNEFIFKGRQFNGYTSPEILEEVCKFEFLPTDIIVSTFPRSGTTFTQEIIWQIKNRKTVKENEQVENTISRFPFIEFNHENLPFNSISFIDTLNSQREAPYRLIKTHVPFDFIKENFEKVNPKMIVVMRNAKDCLVSNYYHYISIPFHGWKGTFDEFFQVFIKETTCCGSYFDCNLEWWDLRNRQNILILFYEDLIKNLSENVVKIANFLDENLTDDELNKIVHNSSFSTMYNNPKVNMDFEKSKFIRKGIIGDWKNHFSEEQSRILDEKIESKFKGTDLKFEQI